MVGRPTRSVSVVANQRTQKTMNTNDYILQGMTWFAAVVFTLIGALAIAALVGAGIERIGEHYEAKERCLKRATNGYEIQQCGR